MTYLLLYELELFRLQQLLRHALGTGLGAEEELPQLLAERRCVLVEKTGELDLEAFDIGLRTGQTGASRIEWQARRAGEIMN